MPSFSEQKHHPAQRAVVRLVLDRNPTRQTTYLRGKSTARDRQAVARNVNIVVTTNSVKGSFLRFCSVAEFRGRIPWQNNIVYRQSRSIWCLRFYAGRVRLVPSGSRNRETFPSDSSAHWHMTGQFWRLRRNPRAGRGKKVETIGLEPTTLALQTRCSPN